MRKNHRGTPSSISEQLQIPILKKLTTRKNRSLLFVPLVSLHKGEFIKYWLDTQLLMEPTSLQYFTEAGSK